MNPVNGIPALISFMLAAACFGAEQSPSGTESTSDPKIRVSATQPASHSARIDPRAEKTLRSMSDKLGHARALSFKAATSMDEPIETGQMAQASRELKVAVHRPDRAFVECHAGDDVWALWYRGKEITLLDKTGNVYASVAAPATIDGMLEDVAQKHGLTLPLADLLFSDPYKVLTQEVRTGRYVGLHEVSGVKCHHLLFTQNGVDWQIWIDAGETPLPRKFVIDYKNAPGRPQFTAIFSDWKLSDPPKEDQFEPVIPKSAQKMALKKLLEVEREE